MKQFLYALLGLTLFVSCYQDDTVIDTDNSGYEFGNFGNKGFEDRSNCDFEAPIYPASDTTLTREQLKELLNGCFAPQQTYTYSQARTYLYSVVDVIDGQLNCIYSDYSTVVTPAGGQSYINAALSKGINCEHVFPQSKGANREPAQADMFHIYPELDNVNSARGNKAFQNIADNNVFEWFMSNQVSAAKPTSDLGEWNRSSDNAWEPRDAVKGDIARSVFYFVLIYEDVADMDYFNSMKATLLDWNEQDPVDAKERDRNDRILGLQGNNNPFILDSSLVNRLFQ